MSSPRRITHLIGHRPWEGTAERTGDVFNPATGEVTGTVDFASAEVVGEVVAKASAAAKEWGQSSLTRRAQVLFAFRQLLQDNKERIAAVTVVNSLPRVSSVLVL